MRIARSITCALVVLLLAGLSLAACGGGGDSAGTSSQAVDQSGARPPAAAEGPAAGGRGAAPERQAGGTAGDRRRAPLAEERRIVHTAELEVRAKDVDAAAAKAKQMAASAGGHVARESSSTGTDRSELTLKIPADRYTELLNRLGAELGTKTSLSQRAEDVTGEVADVDARVRSAKAALESFRKLLDRADSVSEVITIERELAEREADLEALQARQKSLQNRTAFATVTVTLRGEDSAGSAGGGSRGGFVGGLQDGWGAFTAFVGGALTVLGWLLPFLVTAAVLAVPAVALLRRRRAAKGLGRRTAMEPDRPAAKETDRPVAGESGPAPEPDEASA